MDFIVDYTPAPTEHEWVQGEVINGSNGEPPAAHMKPIRSPFSLYVFKTVSDPFAGRISYFKVFSGVLKNDATLLNFSRSTQEKLAHISIMQGKTAVPVHGAACGRHRRGRQTERHAYRRYAGRQVSADPVSASETARTRDHFRHRAQEPRRRRQAWPGHPQAHGRRCHAALLPRSRRPKSS